MTPSSRLKTFQPADLIERIDTLLAEPSKAHADALCDSVLTVTDWEITEIWPVQFMRDGEWNWRFGCRPPLADW
jgi:hypothetical protein